MENRNILIIDNKFHYYLALEMALKARHFNIEVCDSKKDALKRLEKLSIKTGGFDLAIVDIQIEGVSEFDFIKEIRARNPLVPMLIIASNFDKDTEEKLGGVKLCHKLEKPFKTAQILDRIAEILNCGD